jgi:group I intron endonuclease
MLNNNNHDNDFLQKSWNKHGEDYFLFEVLELVSVDNILVREQFFLDKIDWGNRNESYNLCVTAGNMLGFKHSDKTKLKMSNSKLNNKNSLGNKHTDDTKYKMSLSHTNLNHSSDTIVKLIKVSKKDNIISKKVVSRISSDIKDELILKYKTGLYSTRKLSDIYGISKSTIWNIVRT